MYIDLFLGSRGMLLGRMLARDESVIKVSFRDKGVGGSYSEMWRPTFGPNNAVNCIIEMPRHDK